MNRLWDALAYLGTLLLAAVIVGFFVGMLVGLDGCKPVYREARFVPRVWWQIHGTPCTLEPLICGRHFQWGIS